MSESLRKRQQRLLARRNRREQDEADIRLQQHLSLRMAEVKQQREARARTPLGPRIQIALAEARLIGATSAASLDGRVSTGKASSSPPPGASNLLTGEGDVVSEFERKFRLLVERLEAELDSHRVRSIGGDRVTETSEEKDRRLVRDFEGLSPIDVAFLDSSFGSTRAIERARVRMERNPYTGRRSDAKPGRGER